MIVDVRDFNLICGLAESSESGFSTTYCDQTNIRKGYPYKQFQPLISDTKRGAALRPGRRPIPYAGLEAGASP